MTDINLIKDLTTAFGPSGFEDDVLTVIKKIFKWFRYRNRLYEQSLCKIKEEFQ